MGIAVSNRWCRCCCRCSCGARRVITTSCPARPGPGAVRTHPTGWVPAWPGRGRRI